MDRHLIYDIGLHEGQDTKYYLAKGYKVIALDASPSMVKRSLEKFSEEISAGNLTVLNYAVAANAGDKIDFFLSEVTEWNSIKEVVSSRLGVQFDKIQVETTTLPILFQQYGIPYYCKIDIEGYDEVALRTLASVSELPKYISCESECLGENEVISDEEALATLNALNELGYKKFKLVDQETLTVLGDKKFFRVEEQDPGTLFRSVRKVFHLAGYKVIPYNERELLSFRHQFFFVKGSSGPFGNMLRGKWVTFGKARDMLLFHRDHFFKLPWPNKVYTIWCDWHATY